MIRRKTQIILIFGFIFFFNGLVQSISAKQVKVKSKPNILFILADDFGYGDLGSYGQKLTKTPNLDQLAKEGTRFTQVYTSAPVCAPSRASLMTGKHQGHAYIRGNEDKNNQRVSLRPEDTTIAEMLKNAGYRTGIIGKWGLGEPDSTGIPNKKGFDYFYGYLNQNLAHNYYPDYLWRNQEKINPAGKTYSADLFTQEAMDFITRESKNPFFLYLAITLPHANNELNRKTGNGMEIPSDAPYTKENWTQPNKNFAAMVTKMDTDVGKILLLLKQLKIDDNTIVIFTGDNGPQGTVEGSYDASFFNSAGGLRGIKRSLYEGGLREPMIIRWNKKIKAGQTNDAIWSLYDLFPTFAEIIKGKTLNSLDGVSVLSNWLGKQKSNHKYLYWEFHEGGFVQAVRMGNWKAIRKGLNGKIELYDLQKDVTETQDLSAENPKIVAQIIEIMKREHVESPIWDDKDK
jgi:arylsulfatase A-like enzyme